MGENTGVKLKRAEHLFVPLEYLYRVPSLLLLRKIMDDRLLDMGKRVFNGAGESVLRHGLSVFRRVDRSLRRFGDARFLQCRYFDDRAADPSGKLGGIYLIPFLFDKVRHVYRDHHRYAELGELGRQIKVSFKVGAVDYVEDGVGTLADKIVSGHDLLKSVGREGIDAGKIGNDHAVALFEPALFLFHRHPRPVSNELI